MLDKLNRIYVARWIVVHLSERLFKLTCHEFHGTIMLLVRVAHQTLLRSSSCSLSSQHVNESNETMLYVEHHTKSKKVLFADGSSQNLTDK